MVLAFLSKRSRSRGSKTTSYMYTSIQMLVQGSRPPALAITLGANISPNLATATALSAGHLIAVCKYAVGERRTETEGELRG